MPDWRVESDYDFAKDLKTSQWAWEFLRRNREYKKNYETVSANPHGYFYDPPKKSGETDKEWQDRHVLWKMVPLDIHYGKIWGLALGIIDPSDDIPNNLKWERVSSQFVRLNPNSKIPDGKDQLSITLDLNFPIKPQIETVKKYAISKQGELIAKGLVEKLTVRNRNEHWVDYLRILDAQSLKTRRIKIQKILYNSKMHHAGFDPDQYLDGQIKQAKAMTISGYLKILFMSK